jgi:hypothetical protein
VRAAAFYQVRLEYLEPFSINIDHEEAIILGATDNIHHLAHGKCDGDLMIVLVGKGYSWTLYAVVYTPAQLCRGTFAQP